MRTVLSIPPLEKELSEHEQKVFASRWDELKEEDAPLRVLINGCLVGVKDDFYDFLIRRERRRAKSYRQDLLEICC